MSIDSYRKRIEDNLTGLGQLCLLARDAIASLFTWKITYRELFYQFYFIGVTSQMVVLITGAFTGMVFCAQTYFKFHEVKMDTATLAVVSVAMCSELGPVLTALMVTGRVGAAMTAEIGTMRVTEQIDALRTLATHPVDYLVVPRLVAAFCAMPILMLEAAVLGIIASYLLGVYQLGIDPTYSWYNMLHFTHDTEVFSGLIKSFIFGGIIAMIACYKGLTCGLGAEGVGRATTEAVVYSSITILISDFFLSLTLNRIFSY
ncbi:MAG TPA: ABC transporter permease [Verrucomicrobiae bacterium]|nr:ABC transporter permease [Verrucomicrobiae bacterium]